MKDYIFQYLIRPHATRAGLRFVVSGSFVWIFSLSLFCYFYRKLTIFQRPYVEEIFSCFFFFFLIYDSFWFSNFSNLGRGLDCLRFVCKKKKKRRGKSYGYGKRIRVKIKLVEVNHFWNSGRVKRSFDSLLVSTRKKNWSYFFFFFIVACNKFSTCIKFTICREL